MAIKRLIRTPPEETKKRKSGIPTGNAGEYFVMGELLRRGYDAQLADRNTAGYDVLVGAASEPTLRKVQIKTIRTAPWYVKLSDFKDELLNQITIYVLLGKPDARTQVRYFIARNRDLVAHLHQPPKWPANGFMSLRAVEEFDDNWTILKSGSAQP